MEVFKIYTVYIHKNKINNKKYIGITSTNVKRRWKNGYGYSERLPIGKAIRKYGWDNFEHEIIMENLHKEDAKKLEIDLIAKFNTQDRKYGYNLTAGGEGITGWKHSDETRKKISEKASLRIGDKNSNYGNYWDEDKRRQSGEKHRRENLSIETLRKMSEAAADRSGDKNPFFGKKHTDITKQKIAEYRNRSIKMFDKHGVFIKQYPSIKQASIDTKINKVAISNCCRGVTKTSGGYIWKYSDKCDL